MLTVIIPTYNGEKTIARAINSVIAQGYADIEILICDDCSTDKTVEIAKEFEIVRIITNDYHIGTPNVGRNKGLQASQGEFIAFLDQDDTWIPSKLQEQFKWIEEGYDIVYSSCLLGEHLVTE